MNWDTLSQKRVLLVLVIVITGAILIGLYLNWPTILSFDSEESVKLVDVSYPSAIYRTQNLPISVRLENQGNDAKDVMVEVISTYNPTLTNRAHLQGLGSVVDVLVNLPVRNFGDQSFKIMVYWVGPGEICQIYEDSADRSFTGLAADYNIVPLNSVASIAEHFNFALNVTNVGNTLADRLLVKIANEGPLILSGLDTQTIDNLEPGETGMVSFDFSVPHDAKEGKTAITVDFTTCYPTCQEACSQSLAITLQKSPVQVDIENMTELVKWLIPLAIAVVAFAAIFSRKKH